MKQGRPALKIRGRQFGRLTAISLSQDRPLKRRWKCRCSCGNYCDVDQGKLQESAVKSCGCLVKENALKQCRARTLPPGCAFINSSYSTYRYAARRHKRVFDLTLKFFTEVTAKPCHYCGAQPECTRKAYGLNGTANLNGLDRKDSSRGYTAENVVPCCKTCNIAKHTMSVHEFAAWIKRVAQRIAIWN